MVRRQSLAGLANPSQEKKARYRISWRAPALNAQQYLQQNPQAAAQSQLNQLKDKMNKLGNNGGGDSGYARFQTQ